MSDNFCPKYLKFTIVIFRIRGNNYLPIISFSRQISMVIITIKAAS